MQRAKSKVSKVKSPDTNLNSSKTSSNAKTPSKVSKVKSPDTSSGNRDPPATMPNAPLSAKDNKASRRYARCHDCEGCNAPNCGECQSCKLSAKYGDQVRDPVTCEEIVCSNPTDLYGASMNRRHEDGCCPLKEIQGKIYDFRCYFCKVLPRVGSANRSELYRHYSLFHYSEELKKEFGGRMIDCVICCKKITQDGKGFVSHLGQVHNEVEKYLPDAARIPLSIQGKSTATVRRRRQNAPVVPKRNVEADWHWIFPEVPDDYNPRGCQREIIPSCAIEPEAAKVEIDGFVITNEVDEDEEPLFVSREEDPLTMPDYEGKSGRCSICKSTFADIIDAVFHIHERHGILGGSQHIMLDADRLLKGGYISIPLEKVDTTIITEAGQGAFSLFDEEEEIFDKI